VLHSSCCLLLFSYELREDDQRAEDPERLGIEMTEIKRNPVVGIASILGGISLCVVAVIAIFAREQLWVAIWIVAALAAMGIGLGFFASKG
jgi:hypothetical protein